MNITLVEPFYTGSHKQWALNLQRYSKHNISIVTLPGRFWKWRMHGAAVTLASKMNDLLGTPDLLVATDMLDVAVFKALLDQRFTEVPILLYFHENQITYPWSLDDPDPGLQRDRHYGFINYTSCLAADRIAFNSLYHMEAFLNGLEDYLQAMPDYQNLETILEIKEKSSLLYLGVDLTFSEAHEEELTHDVPVVLWNHRWEYDKNPDLFFAVLDDLARQGIDFGLIICGEHTQKYPPVFEEARERFDKQLIHFGYVEEHIQYRRLLAQADVMPVTSVQDFFGISVIEGIHGGSFPLLPKRLAYPEHVPDDLKKEVLYDSDDLLRHKLKEYLSNYPDLSKKTSCHDLRKFIQKYNWQTRIDEYDVVFNSLMA